MELLSALTPDFALFLMPDGKLDREAVQDCATFLQATIGRQRDRNANCWAMLLYFMLVLNMLFQADVEDQKRVFVWMVKSVSRAAYELNNHKSLLEQFVLAVIKVRETRTNPLVRNENEVLFLHNMRLQSSPNHRIFRNNDWLAFRLEHVLAVIKQVLNKTFSMNELYREANESSFAQRGHAMFYDCATNSWPIAHSIYDDETRVTTLIPLAEDELLEDHVKRFRCLWIKKVKYDEITESSNQAENPVNYEDLQITSSSEGQGTYNFYEAVTGIDRGGWFGYRVLRQSSFAQYCGTTNELDFTEPVSHVIDENEEAGAVRVDYMYQPRNLLQTYCYAFPDASKLPPGLLKIPFVARNEPGDDEIDYDLPPWTQREQFVGESEAEVYFSQSSGDKDREDDELSEFAGGPSAARSDAGSIPPLRNVTNEMNGNSNGPRRQKRTRCAFLDDEAEASGGSEEEQVPSP